MKFVLCLLCQYSFQTTEQSGKAVIRFIDYKNPSSKKLNGDCCTGGNLNKNSTSFNHETGRNNLVTDNNNDKNNSIKNSISNINNSSKNSNNNDNNNNNNNNNSSKYENQINNTEISYHNPQNSKQMKKELKCGNTTCLNVFYLCISDIVGTPPCDMVQLDSLPLVTSSDDVITFPNDKRDMRMAYPFNYTFYKWSVSNQIRYC